MNRYSLHLRKAVHATIAAVLMTAHTAQALPEVWQRLYNGNEIFPGAAFPFGPSDDPDGDGWTNQQESIAGTDPFSSQAGQGYLVPTIEARLYPAGQFRLQWPSQPGKEYQIQISQDLTTWTPVGGKHLGGDYPIVVDMAPELLEGGRPPLLFWRVETGDQPVPGGGLDPWSLHILSTRSDIRYAMMMAAQGIGGPEEDPNTDAAGPTDRYDAAPRDNQINWEKVPEARYLWLPADGAGIAVDMNDKGQILYKLPNGSGGFDFTEAPVGEVWDPALPSGQRRTPVMFNPAGFQLRMWKADHAPGPNTNPHIPSGDDVPVQDAVIWPPPEGDDNRSASAFVELKAIGDDGSVAADVYYSMAEKFGGQSESPSRFVSGDFVFLWKSGDYDRGELVGDGRGFLSTISTSSRNHAVGFYEHSEEGTVTTRLMLADHPAGGTGQPTPLAFHAHDPAHPSNAPLDITTGQAARPQYQYPPDAKISRTGKVLFTRLEGTTFRGVVGGTIQHGDLPETVRDFDSITDIPPGATASWGIGSAGVFMTPAHGATANLVSATGILQFDRTGTGIGSGKAPPGNPARFIWRNTRWITLDKATNLPASTFDDLLPRKITPSGMIWLRNENGTQNGVLIPITAKDDNFATGVDDESIQADPLVDGYQDRFWIMVPAGETDPNAGILRTPLAGPATLGFDAATASPAVIAPGGPGVDTPVSWSDGGSTYGDRQITASITGGTAHGHPIALKVMKKRTIRVLVQPVGYNRVTLPDQTALENRLREIYGKQLNAWPEVTYGEWIQYNADTDGDALIDLGSPEGPALAAKGNMEGYDIKVIMSDGCLVAPSESGIAGIVTGYAPPDSGANTCFVAVNRYEKNAQGVYEAHLRPMDNIIHTVAHEIGHIILDDGGHPDHGEGVAPLDHSLDRTKRLMCSGHNNNNNSILLVKKEWDKAEIWLQANPDRRSSP